MQVPVFIYGFDWITQKIAKRGKQLASPGRVRRVLDKAAK
jgi:hypothetical protein